MMKPSGILAVSALCFACGSDLAVAQLRTQVFDREEYVPVDAKSVAQPPVVIHSLQSPQGSVANVDAEADVYRAPNNEPLTYSVFLNLNSSTGTLFPGAMMADNMGLRGGYQHGSDDLSSYDALFFRSSSDPQPGLADFHMALWDGDPFCVFDTPGGGFSCMPIPGTEADFIDIPANSKFTARHVMPKGVTTPNQRVWMVVSGSETGVNPSPCRLGWDIAYGPAVIGDNDIPSAAPFDDFFLTQEDRNNGADGTNGLGQCCDDPVGAACDASSPCPTDSGGTRGACWDDFAETPGVFTLSTGPGTRCDMYAGRECSNFTAGIRATAFTTISLVPTGNDAAGNLNPGAVIEGNMITLADAGTTVFIEIRLGDWDPHDDGSDLHAWEVDIDASGYTSGLEGALTPQLVACSTDADCRAAFGGFCTQTGDACILDTDCGLAPIEECGGSNCSFPWGVGGFCEPGFMHRGRQDYVFFQNGSEFPGIDLSSLNYRYASTITGGLLPPEPFPEGGVYAGSLVLHIPVNAKGTFTVGMLPPPNTVLIDDRNHEFLSLVGLIPAQITVSVGRCCYKVNGASRCADNLTQAQCDGLTDSDAFSLGETCSPGFDTCDCNDNGVLDADDVANGTSLDCNTNTIPDECEADCNGNGQPDDCDVADGTSNDCDSNLRPDECDPDCNSNGIPDVCDIDAGTSTDCNRDRVPDECNPRDCNGNGIPDACDASSGIGQDCNENGLLDECDIAFGISGDCDSNGVPNECEPNCNQNSLADVCEIVWGYVADCNRNWIPDWCELRDGTSDDCNANDILDECDVSTGASTDCNSNGLLDECELDASVSIVSPILSLVGWNDQQSFVIPSADRAESNVTFTVTAYGDFGGPGLLRVALNGQHLGSLFASLGHDCPVNPDVEYLVISSETYNAAIVPGNQIVTLTGFRVNSNLCPEPSFVSAIVQFDRVVADCDNDGVPDDCTPDCNGDGIPNVCAIADGTSFDLDSNGVPDDCECPPRAPLAETPAIAKSRYLSFDPGNWGQQTALRLTLIDLPQPFDVWNGLALWVGPPNDVSMLGARSDETTPTFKAATLQCQPYFMDWADMGTIHVWHEAIIPSAGYQVHAIDMGCDRADESSYSLPLDLTTGVWGDVSGAFADGVWSPPDGVVSVAFDAVAIVDAFMSRSGAPIKPRVDLSPNIPDQLISVSDLTKVLFAFSGSPYPFVPGPAPCDGD